MCVLGKAIRIAVNAADELLTNDLKDFCNYRRSYRKYGGSCVHIL